MTLSLKMGGGQDEITLLGAAKIVTPFTTIRTLKGHFGIHLETLGKTPMNSFGTLRIPKTNNLGTLRNS